MKRKTRQTKVCRKIGDEWKCKKITPREEKKALKKEGLLID